MYVLMTIICPKSGRRTIRLMMQKSEKKNSAIPTWLISVAYTGEPCPIVYAIEVARRHSPNEYGRSMGAYFLGPSISCQ